MARNIYDPKVMQDMGFTYFFRRLNFHPHKILLNEIEIRYAH